METITSISNQENKYVITFAKTKTFFHFLHNFLAEFNCNFKIPYEEKQEGFDIVKYEVTADNEFDDYDEVKCEIFESFIVYGFKKVIMLVNIEDKYKQQFSKILFKYCKMPKSDCDKQ